MKVSFTAWENQSHPRKDGEKFACIAANARSWCLWQQPGSLLVHCLGAYTQQECVTDTDLGREKLQGIANIVTSISIISFTRLH